MKGQAVGAEAHIALLHGGLKELLHLAELIFSGLAAHARLKAHHFYPEHRVRYEGSNVRAQRHVREVVHVIPGVVPGDFLGDFAQYGFRDVLNPGKAVNDGFLFAGLLRAETGAEAAVAHQHSRSAVADDLGQCGLHVDLEIEMRVDVEHAGHQPLVRAIYNLCGGVGGQAIAASGDLAVAHGHVLNAGQRATAIKNLGALNQQIPTLCHGVAP